jgi:hypothetical protein
MDRFGRWSIRLWEAWKREFLREPHVILFQRDGGAYLAEGASREDRERQEIR